MPYFNRTQWRHKAGGLPKVFSGSKMVVPQARRSGTDCTALGRTGQEQFGLIRPLRDTRPVDLFGLGKRVVGCLEIAFE